MKSLELTEAAAPLADYARNIASEPLILTEAGKPVAALVPLANTDWEALSLGTNPDFLALIERSRSHQATQGGISSEEMRRRLGASAWPVCGATQPRPPPRPNSVAL